MEELKKLAEERKELIKKIEELKTQKENEVPAQPEEKEPPEKNTNKKKP